MSDTPNNHGILGLAALLFLLGGQSGAGGYGKSGALSSLGNLPALGKTLPLNRFARDMHRVVAMMDQVEGLTQMAGIGQLASSGTAAAQQPRITGAADSVSDAFSGAFESLNSQDLSQLMELAGPLMSMLGSTGGKK